MQIPVKAHYAAIAMLALAARYRDGELVTARAVSAEHDVPNQFLVQILQQLRSAGLVCSLSFQWRLQTPAVARVDHVG